MVEVDEFTVRTTLHILAVAVWVGGQGYLAGLLPAVRKLDDDQAGKKLARQFNRIAWPAFALAVVTGIWNIAEVDIVDRSTAYQVLLLLTAGSIWSAPFLVIGYLVAILHRHVNRPRANA